MANDYKTPGVYVEEITKFPPSVAQVETAIPAFIGYTQNVQHPILGDLKNKPRRITSMVEYERLYGFAQNETGITAEVVANPNTGIPDIKVEVKSPSKYKMYYSLQFYFANGGGPCYIVSVGDYSTNVVDFQELSDGLKASDKVDEVTLLLLPDAHAMNADNYYNIYKAALDSCVKLQDRFTVLDAYVDPATNLDLEPLKPVQILRDKLSGSVDVLKYGAVYYPPMETILDYQFADADVEVKLEDGSKPKLDSLKNSKNALYFQVRAAIRDKPLTMMPSAGIVGIYADTDANRGVWKAPANVGMDYVIRPSVIISDEEQKDLNVDVNGGKSVNIIRTFTGRGPAIVWGARTLAGNDNEWRYISVRRFCNMVEESVKKACNQFVFEPNDANTWVRVRAMIENFLILQWRAGALQGAKPDHAFYVAVGLNQTMTAIDVLEGRMIVEIGMAVVRPAEFIILKFSQMMPQS
ncbi:MAG: phage tail sheath family protein [Saprospiraceae bacterium]|nr:phage tail sheath family protein [Saprospiraceae bacterium]